MMRKFLIALAIVGALGACKEPSVNDELDRLEEQRAAQVQTNLEAAAKYLAENAKKEGVVTTASGLQYQVIKPGDASLPSPKPDDLIVVNYEGRYIDGKVFDSSYANGQPASLPLGNTIAGWVEALQLMKPGAEYRLIVPPKLGYGPRGKGEVPPNALLIFKVELLGFQRAADGAIVKPGGVVAGPKAAAAQAGAPKPAAAPRPAQPKPAAPKPPPRDGQVQW